MEYAKKSQKELKQLCKERNLKGYSTKKKDELIELLTSPTTSACTSPLKNKSPLRYPGGKTRAIAIIESYLKQYYPDQRVLLSPFFGGGSFELYLSTKGYIVKGNDLFVPLYTFWKTQQSAVDLLVEKIRAKMPVTKEVFQQLRQSISAASSTCKEDEEADEEADIASSYFVINRTSFSGATLCGGFSNQAAEKRLTASSIQRLRSCNTTNITFTNVDCKVFLENHPQTAATVLYADPPYYIESYIYGKDGDLHEKFDHESFAKKILTRSDWLISYNDCDYIRALYKECRIFKVQWAYGMNASKKSSEIIILPPLSS